MFLYFCYSIDEYTVFCFISFSSFYLYLKCIYYIWSLLFLKYETHKTVTVFCFRVFCAFNRTKTEEKNISLNRAIVKQINTIWRSESRFWWWRLNSTQIFVFSALKLERKKNSKIYYMQSYEKKKIRQQKML